MLIKRKSIEQAESSRRPAPRKARKPKFAPVTLSEQDGVRYLHFGTEWVQGAMRIRKPDWPELEYAQQMMAWMLFIEQPRAIAQLGLGAATLTKFCYRQFPQALVTAVELNPSVIAICASMFKLPPTTSACRCWRWMRSTSSTTRPTRGLRRAAVRPVRRHRARPGARHARVLPGLQRLPGRNGVMTVNLFGDHPSF
jgi:hypothetical protein